MKKYEKPMAEAVELLIDEEIAAGDPLNPIPTPDGSDIGAEDRN